MKLRNILLLLTVFFAFYACDDDTYPRLEMPTESVVLEALENNNVVIKEENLEDVILNLKWEAQTPAPGTIIRYVIQVDVLGNEFAKAKTLEETSELTYSATGDALNAFFTKNFEQVASTTVRYELRIVPILKGKDESILYPSLMSESQILIVTTTKLVAAAPDKIFMIGAQFGDWNWESADVVEMTPVNEQVGEFWTVKYIEAGKGFKWAPQRAWADDFSELATSEGFTTKDGNAFVAESGLYMVYINYIAGKITIEKAQISGVGECWGEDWTEGNNPFDVSGKVATITTKVAGELRITAGSSATKTDWWRREFILIDGVIQYRGNGGDQDRVNVGAGKKITLDFNTNTGKIE